jgi:hypothetical protein
MYTVRVNFGEKPIPKNKSTIWNLIQMYAAKNDSIIQGKSLFSGTYLVFTVGVKRRMGPPREDDPN